MEHKYEYCNSDKLGFSLIWDKFHHPFLAPQTQDVQLQSPFGSVKIQGAGSELSWQALQLDIL